MGSTIAEANVCEADGICDYFPNPGPLWAFDGQDPRGTWLLCGTDSGPGDLSSIAFAELQLGIEQASLCAPGECGGAGGTDTCYCDTDCFSMYFDCCINFCDACDLGC
jgi:hypothetical protein